MSVSAVQVTKKSIGETTPPKYWNQKKRRCNVPRDFPEGEDINIIIEKWEIAAKKTVERFKTCQNTPKTSEFWEYLNSTYYEDANRRDSYVVNFLAKFIEDKKGNRAESTVKKYVTTLNKLQEYEKEQGKNLKFSDIDIHFYNSFQRWIYKKGLSATISVHL